MEENGTKKWVLEMLKKNKTRKEAEIKTKKNRLQVYNQELTLLDKKANPSSEEVQRARNLEETISETNEEIRKLQSGDKATRGETVEGYQDRIDNLEKKIAHEMGNLPKDKKEKESKDDGDKKDKDDE